MTSLPKHSLPDPGWLFVIKKKEKPNMLRRGETHCACVLARVSGEDRVVLGVGVLQLNCGALSEKT